MVFVQLMTMKPTVSNQQRVEWLKKRAAWKAPPQVRIIAEYSIPAGANKVVLIYEAPDGAAIPAMRAPWLDWFDADVYPAMAVEELTQMLGQIAKSLGVKA